MTSHTQMPPGRRTFLARTLTAAGVIGAAPAPTLAAERLVVNNVTGLYAVEVARVAAPRSIDELSKLVTAWPGQVAVGGGRYSMGGQIAIRGGLHVDLRRLNGLVWLHPASKTVRVQAGMRWRDLQDLLDPVGLAVMTMQSYANFTVGGSVSVNAHGRYVGHGPVGHSVRALQIMLADGTVVESSRTLRPELFRAAIGGYGAVGVITEVELDVTDNVRIERAVESVALERYVEHVSSAVLSRPDAVLHNADLLPPGFDAPVSVTWYRAPDDRPLTEPARLVERGRAYTLEQNVIWAMTEVPGGRRLRQAVVHPLLTSKPSVKWLNHEASLDAAELEPRTRAVSTYVLQEYFVPAREFLGFAREMARILRSHNVEALNVSIRHTSADRDALLAWAREDVFSFVLYFKQRTWQSARRSVERWTRELTDSVIRHEGCYYLPYQLHASREQFEACYPHAEQLRAVKRSFDPAGKWSNELWRKYL
ncbi:MAG TPA: FAD-binding oxidoreductase [Burkholderiaceae bacterium]|nr:FAD-binding oxidoreductase [Burkholderiaceae bacterium]